MTQEQKDKFIKNLNIPLKEASVLSAGASHKYNCKCKICEAYWCLVKSANEDEDNPDYGPFSAEEIKEAKDKTCP